MPGMFGQNSMDARESERVYTSHALTDTPYQSLMSRQSMSWMDSPPKPSSHQLRFDLADGHDSHSKIDAASDDTISPLDPRRFTPTLHASLVSEILSLRRELEGKSSTIESLELSLDLSRSEEESLKESLATNAKETRALKKQLQLLEGGSLSAVDEITKERDEAWESIAESRRRLEDAQKRAKSHLDQAERTQELWDLDRQRWEDERRKLETKVHIVEGRLKAVINEITTSSQSTTPNGVHSSGHHVEQPDNHLDEVDMAQATSIPNGVHDAMSVRSNSPVVKRRNSNSSVSTFSSVNHVRHSGLSLVNGTNKGGINLADELAFDDSGDEEADTPRGITTQQEASQTIPGDGLPSPIETRPMSSQSLLSGQKARRILGLSFDSMSPQSSPVREHWSSPASPRRSLFEIPETPLCKTTYRDVGIQFTPPPSPSGETTFNGVYSSSAPPPEAPSTPPEAEDTVGVTGKSAPPYETLDMGVQTSPAAVVSTECQTTDNSLDIPSQQDSETEDADHRPDQSLMVSVSTQTDEIPSQLPMSVETPGWSIPMITIDPPMSNPVTPRTSVVLPPQTKNAFSQTIPELSSSVRSSSMQTEEIRVDRRPIRIPSDLLPSAFPDYPVEISPVNEKKPPITYQPYRPPGTSVPTIPRLRDPPPVDVPMPMEKTSQAYPGNNDNGPLTGDMQREIRRPFRSSSLFAGFDHESDDDTPHFAVDEVFNDDDSILNRPMASYVIRMGKLVSKPTGSSLDESPMEMHEDEEFMSSQQVGDDQTARGSLRRSSATRGKSSLRGSTRSNKLGPTRQPPNIRRTAIMSSSVAAHQSLSRPRSPSVPNMANQVKAATRPPFPVPTRFSSRKVPAAASEGAQSPTPCGSGSISDHGSMGRDFTLRKIRSAAAVTKPQYREDHASSTRSPTAMSISSAGPESPQYSHRPPHSFDTMTHSSKNPSLQGSRRPSRAGEHYHERKESTAAVSVQQTSVVDAIAQTMVGEWMYKYVRRRKSFGMSETPKDKDKDGIESGKTTEEISATVSGNGVRHKRWVWLAPYERAVMWSSKQPTSGSALLGKSGRKLIIQSVLDVKDENPLPRGATQQNSFNRSILILTPQRALKFTALSLERHFVWLTALSFLSHSSIGLDDLATLPPVPQGETGQRPLTAALRRNPIRDSIRVAKGKNRPNPHKSRAGATNQATVPEESFPEMPAGPDHNMDSAADPPNVPRFASHSRKRSNTAPKPMPNPFRSFSGNAIAPSTYSSTTAGSSDLYSPASAAPSVVHSGQSSFSHRTSEASGHPPAGMANFFDAVGTVRMEAFVDRGDVPRPRGFRGKKREQWPQHSDVEYRESENGSNDFFRTYDPFKGF